nr:uncharacterized protein LOC113804414 [Penaeus vannamei]
MAFLQISRVTGILLLVGVTARAALLPSGSEVLTGDTGGSFSCEGRGYGYFADMQSGCQLFHVCVPVADAEGQVQDTLHFPFFCGNQTIFNQETLTCTLPEDAFPCDQAPSLYDVINSRFGDASEPSGSDLGFQNGVGFQEDLGFQGNSGFRDNTGFRDDTGFQDNLGFQDELVIPSESGFQNGQGFENELAFV